MRIPSLLLALLPASAAAMLLGAPPPLGGPADPPFPPPSAWSPAPPAQDTLAFTPELLALGERVYHGRDGGALCSVCHGTRGRGTPRGPSLADSTWQHVDGSYASLVGLVTHGVTTGREHVRTMLPEGGALLTDAQVRAVAAYVYALTHPEVRRPRP